jgi:hypothetical protein
MIRRGTLILAKNCAEKNIRRMKGEADGDEGH